MLILPFFTVLIVVLISMMKISMTETALQSTVSETVKVLATHMYPVQLIYDEANEMWQESRIAQSIDELMSKIHQAKQQLEQVDEFVDEYRAYIPDSLVPIVEVMRKLQDDAWAQGRSLVNDYEQHVWNPFLHAAFRPLVIHYADERKLDVDKVQLTEVILPDLQHKENAYLGIEATYAMILPLPFVSWEIRLTKRAYERVWVGGI